MLTMAAFEGTITGQDGPPIEPPPVEPPVWRINLDLITDLVGRSGRFKFCRLVMDSSCWRHRLQYPGRTLIIGTTWSRHRQYPQDYLSDWSLVCLPASQYWVQGFSLKMLMAIGDLSSNVATATTDASETPEPPPGPPPTEGETDLSKLVWAPDWRGRSDGTNAASISGMFATDGVIDNSIKLGDHPSARDDIRYGDQGWEDPVRPGGYVGMAKSPGGMTKENDEMWFRIYQRTSAGFNHSSNEGPVGSNASDCRKTMRLSGGSQRCDWQYCGKRQDVWDWNENKNVVYEAGSWHVANETTQDRRHLDLTGKFLQPDLEWVCIEAYCKFHRSNGVMKLWQNGEMVGNTERGQTADPKYYGNKTLDCMYINFWNSGAPKNQTLWWARPAIAVKKADGSRDDTRHMGHDASGFPFIGLAV